MKDIKERIAELVEKSGGNQSEFARKLGIKPNHFSMVLSTDSGLSASILFKFAELGVNMNWLMQGKGEIWQSELEINSVLQTKINDLTSELERAYAVIEFTERVLKGTQNQK